MRLQLEMRSQASTIAARSSVEHTHAADLAGLIEAIGCDNFADRVLSYLHNAYGVQRCAMFEVASDTITPICESLCIDKSRVASRLGRHGLKLYCDDEYWRRDPGLYAGLQQLEVAKISLVRIDIPSLTDVAFRYNIYQRAHIRERILLCTGSVGAAVALSILRQDSTGVFSSEEMSRLCAEAETIMSLILKHLDIVKRESAMGTALSSLSTIIRSLATLPVELSTRETDVCARILYGMSAGEIAASLGIGLASIVTYRKRAYQKLNVTTQRELLMWYMQRWGQQGTPRVPDTLSHASS